MIIKKILLSCICIFSICGYSQNKNTSEKGAWTEENHVITFGYGAPHFFKIITRKAVTLYSENHKVNLTDNVSFDTKGIGPLFFKYEYGLSKIVGVGLNLGYWNTEVKTTHNYFETDKNSGNNMNYQDVIKFKVSSFSFGGKLNLHFATTEKVDPYAGIAAGFNINRIKIAQTSTNPNYLKKGKLGFGIGFPLYLAFTVGARYYLFDNFGFYAEVGIDKLAIIQGGLTFRFL